MKNVLILFITIYCSSILNAQTNLQCKYFESYKKEEHDLIKKNWKQYFFNDLSDLNKDGFNVYPLLFDSYGCIYPDFSLFENADGDNMFEKVKNFGYQKVEKHSLKHLLLNNNKKFIDNSIKIKDKDEQKIITEVLKNDYDDSTFCAKWQKFYVTKKVKEINKIIEGKKKVIFFIHGYNVPYSLAQVQMLSLAKILRDSIKYNIDEFIMIPIFWASGDLKEKGISSCNGFNILDSKSSNNFKGLLNYSNRCYYTAIELRKIINQINFNGKDVYIFAHSLGNTIATSLTINTVSKLDMIHKNKYQNEFKTENIRANLTPKTLADIRENDKITYEIISGFDTVPIPRKVNFKIFMSAPAISGNQTFCDMDDSSDNNTYYVNVNLKDKTLNKKVVLNIPVGSTNFGMTTLGCTNYDCIETAKYFKKNPSRYSYEMLKSQQEHDIFYYYNNQSYINRIKKCFGN